jgi:hypothetical protein
MPLLQRPYMMEPRFCFGKGLGGVYVDPPRSLPTELTLSTSQPILRFGCLQEDK